MPFNMDKIILWNKFKERLLGLLDEAPAFEVDLSFEYKKNKEVISYSSGDKFHIVNMKFSAYGELCFEVAYGSTSRFIPLSYADQISNRVLGELDALVDKVYAEIIEEMTEADDLPENIVAFSNSIDLREVNSFNNSAAWIEKTIREAKDKETFGSMDQFGMF